MERCCMSRLSRDVQPGIDSPRLDQLGAAVDLSPKWGMGLMIVLCLHFDDDRFRRRDGDGG